jgi:transcription initiation factor TFIIF subunit beta
VRVEPRDIREEERLLQQKMIDAEANKSKLRIISRNAASTIVNPGTAGAVNWGGNFIVSFGLFSLTFSTMLTV